MPVRPRRDRIAPDDGRGGYWIVDFRLAGKRHRYTVRATNARDAARLERELWATAEAEAREGHARLRHGPALQDLAERYWHEHGRHLAWAPHVKAHLDTWCDTLGDRTPAKTITAATVARITGAWRQDLAPATINRRLAILRAIWYRARDVWGIELPRIAWGKLSLREPEPEDRSLTPEDRRRFLDALPDRTRLPMLFILFTGLRRSAALRVTRADLDWQRGIVRTTSKGSRPTPVPITRAVLALFTALGRLPDCGRIFTVTPSMWRRDVAMARKATGLANAGAHPMRHSFAQDLEDAGHGDLVTAALHHSTPALRRRYAKSRLSRTAAILDQIQN